MKSLKPGEADCSLCKRAPGRRNDCPLKGHVQAARAAQGVIECAAFEPINLAREERKAAAVLPEGLF